MIFANAKKTMTSEIADDLTGIKAIAPNCTISLVYTSMSDAYRKKKGQFHLKMSLRKSKICVHFIKSVPLSTHLLIFYGMKWLSTHKAILRRIHKYCDCPKEKHLSIV